MDSDRVGSKWSHNQPDHDGVLSGNEGLGAPPVLLGILGAWGDTMTDEEVLIALRDWNDQIKRKAS